MPSASHAGTGLLITSMFGPSLNGNTGDWSAGVSGFWFDGGQIAYPVSEITVAGNLIDLWSRMQRGSDLEFRSSFNSPSLLFDAVASVLAPEQAAEQRPRPGVRLLLGIPERPDARPL